MNKKEAILSAALQLFADEEYAAVSTMKIAQSAGVSDALIFKHFKNKNNLFLSVLDIAESAILKQINTEKNISDPKVFIKEIIEIPFNISAENYVYWKLYSKLKWNKNVKRKDIWQSTKENLVASLTSLLFQEAEKETGIIIMNLKSIIDQIILNGKPSILQYKYFLIHKYTL